MADIIVPNTDNIEQQFSALSSIREQYDSSWGWSKIIQNNS